MKEPIGQESVEIGSESQVDDSEPLLRLLWAEHDVQNSNILPEAISRRDLERPDRGFSVDREQLAQRKTMEALIEHQRPKGNKPEDRQTPFLSRIASANAVRELKDSNGERPFMVVASPTEGTAELPPNPAHAEIKSVQKCSNRSRLNERRQLLLSVLGSPVKFVNYWDQHRKV
jgi:hypothetical protein